MKKKKLLALIGSICLVLVLAALPFMVACAAPAPPTPAPPTPAPPTPAPPTPAPPTSIWENPPIIIGVPNAFSGVMSMYGLSCSAGIEQAIGEINTSGGILNRPLKMIKRDSRLNPEVAVREVKDLILNQDADFIIGILSSGVAKAVEAYCASQKTIFIINAARSTNLTEAWGNRYTFRIASNFVSRDSAILQTVVAKYGDKYKKVAELNLDYEQGHNAYEDTLATYKELIPDMELVCECWPPLGTTDWTPYILKLMASEGDILIHALYGGAYLSWLAQATPMGIYEKFIVCESCSSDEEVIQVLTEKDPVPVGHVWKAEWPYWALPSPEGKELAQKFMDRTGQKAASEQSLQAYLAVYALKKAIEAAGSLDTEKIIDNMEGMSIDTPMGPILIRACDHQAMWPVYAGIVGFIPGQTWPCATDVWCPEDVTSQYHSCEEVEAIRAAAK